MSKERGQIFVFAVIALGVVLFSSLSIIAAAQIYYSNSNYALMAEQATALAEAGIDKAITSLNKTGGSYEGEAETVLGNGSYSVEITSKDTATKVIKATGFVPNKQKSKAKRIITISASRGVGVAFIYGIQIGEGGLELGNSNVVTGSVYSNGSIKGGNDNSISGDVYVAGGSQGIPEQQTDCEGANCSDFIFGRNWNGNSQTDAAQSFKPQASGILNKVTLKVRKIGNPSDLIMRIMSDKNGKPDKNDILTSGTLYSNLVTTTYAWIDVTFSSTPNLNADTTYWMMLDASEDSNNYWAWQSDLAQSYTRGNGAYSPGWNVGNPQWNVVSEDLSFKTIMGGAVTFIRGGNNFNIGGSVHANTIDRLLIAKDAYFQTIINSQVSGASYPLSSDPPPKVFPISDANVLDWKNQAQTNGVSVGDITTCPSILESKKIVGNVTFGSNCTVLVKSPVWITGNLTINSNNVLRLDSSYGNTSGVIVVDGKIELGSNNHLQGTGQGSSVLMALSNFDSRISGEEAIEVENTGNSGVFYASLGIIEPGNHNSFKELTAWGIRLVNNSSINYETGLSSTLFTSGPSGTYSLVKGTYQVK